MYLRAVISPELNKIAVLHTTNTLPNLKILVALLLQSFINIVEAALKNEISNMLNFARCQSFKKIESGI